MLRGGLDIHLGLARLYVGVICWCYLWCFFFSAAWVVVDFGFMLVAVVEFDAFCCFRRNCGVYSGVLSWTCFWICGIRTSNIFRMSLFNLAMSIVAFPRSPVASSRIPTACE